MKLITAYIKPEKLPDVKQELYKAEVYRMSVTTALGCGQQKGFTTTYRGIVTEVNLLKKIRLEIAVNDDFVDRTVNAIVAGVKGGNGGGIGDGKIFITPLEECIRIRTEERGTAAIGG